MTTQPTTTTPPALAQPGDTSIGVQIHGASYKTILARLTRGQRKATSGEIKPSKTHVTQLEGKQNWMLWRTYIAAIFSHHLEGRLWYLIHDHPATSIEAYRPIFSLADDEKPIDEEEAEAYRRTDLNLIGSVLIPTLAPKTANDVVNLITDEGIDGQAVWRTLFGRYGGKDVASMQKAEMDMANAVLGTLSVQEVTQYLELLFAQLYMAGGEPVSEVRKISLALRVFTNTAFDSG
ncbi:unnamed protein product, partial [Tilletia laevis]